MGLEEADLHTAAQHAVAKSCSSISQPCLQGSSSGAHDECMQDKIEEL